MAKKTKLPADINKRAKSIVDIATREVEDIKKETANEIQSATAALGRLKGLKGYKAKAKSTTKKRFL